MSLEKKKCVPCEGGVDKLGADGFRNYCVKWRAGRSMMKNCIGPFSSKTVIAMDFVNKLSDIAEGEGHHPDFCVHYNRVDVTLWTHAINGLTENDFIVAAKLDKIRV